MRRYLQLCGFVGGLVLVAACQDGLRSVATTAPGTPLADAASASLPHINNTALPMPVSVNAALSITDCSNHPGPQITLDGVAALEGFGVGLTFSNNLKDTHTYTVDKQVNAELQPSGTDITIPKQPVLGGVGGNPFIWVQFTDARGNPTSDEIFLGRCVQGSRLGFTHAQTTPANANADFTISGCNNSPGPFISVDAGMAFDGLGLRVIFRNSDNPVGGPHEAVVSQTLSVLPAGLSFTFPKQPVAGGVGGNPWIFAQFVDGNGAALGDLTLLGRCVQISQS